MPSSKFWGNTSRFSFFYDCYSPESFLYIFPFPEIIPILTLPSVFLLKCWWPATHFFTAIVSESQGFLFLKFYNDKRMCNSNRNCCLALSHILLGFMNHTYVILKYLPTLCFQCSKKKNSWIAKHNVKKIHRFL